MAASLKKVERPRELNWFQAGAMLYGDWGTSKAYVLGIAFALAGHASWFFLGIMAALTAMIGICYTIICQIYPDGGGVYSSVRHTSRTLAVIGAFLLIADYVVTVSISTLDAFHYFNVPHPEKWAAVSILVIGVLNWVGPTKAGSLAVVIGLLASCSAGILFLSTLPSLPHVELTWPSGGAMKNWSTFVGIVLALSGVEAVANMTGIMKEPVEKTSKKAIWPVLLEVSILTFLLGIAMNAISGLTGHTEDMLRAIASHYIGPWYGVLISIIFGFLLLSAANTAIGDLVSIQFLMAKDRELPPVFTQLNRFGMPGLALIIATAIPAFVLVIEHNIVRLASLYAIGVVGAITLNLGSCALNKNIQISKHERFLLSAGAVILALIEITIMFEKHNALLFAVSILGVGLTLRYMGKTLVPAPAVLTVPAVEVLTVSEAKEIAPLYKSSSLVALKSLNLHLLDETALRIKALGENSVYLNYVEETPPSRDIPIDIEPSSESIELLSRAQQELEKRGVTAVPIWQYGVNPGKMVARAAKELGVQTVLIGATKRSALINLVRGDVLRTLARSLPRDCHLVISG
ncbi:MAG: amino acid permease [Candidatus Omnitrophica bacterium]|nr:amino acid permease [Candidatus Omnitrophota bacterium]